MRKAWNQMAEYLQKKSKPKQETPDENTRRIINMIPKVCGETDFLI